MMYGRRPFVKHCPVEFIHYVSDHYQYLWEEMERSSVDKLMKSMTNDTEDTGLDSIKIKTPKFSNSNHSTNLLSLSLIGTLLIDIPTIRPSGKVNEVVDESCRSLIRGLLEVRIINRLGCIFPSTSISSNLSLESHECLKRFSYNSKSLKRIESHSGEEDDNELIQIQSPLLSDDRMGYLSGHGILHPPIAIDPMDDIDDIHGHEDSLPVEIREKFEEVLS